MIFSIEDYTEIHHVNFFSIWFVHQISYFTQETKWIFLNSKQKKVSEKIADVNDSVYILSVQWTE
jgi:hypothetical protein